MAPGKPLNLEVKNEPLKLRVDSYVLQDSYNKFAVAVIAEQEDDFDSPYVFYKVVELDDIAGQDEAYVYSVLFAIKLAINHNWEKIEILLPRTSIVDLINATKRYRKDFDVVDKPYWFKLFRALEQKEVKERITDIRHDISSATLLAREFARIAYENNLNPKQ